MPFSELNLEAITKHKTILAAWCEGKMTNKWSHNTYGSALQHADVLKASSDYSDHYTIHDPDVVIILNNDVDVPVTWDDLTEGDTVYYKRTDHRGGFKREVYVGPFTVENIVTKTLRTWDDRIFYHHPENDLHVLT